MAGNRVNSNFTPQMTHLGRLLPVAEVSSAPGADGA